MVCKKEAEKRFSVEVYFPLHFVGGNKTENTLEKSSQVEPRI